MTETSPETAAPRGAIDCDLHPTPPSLKALTPYMDAFWADQVVDRGMTTLDTQSWPIGSPKTIREDWRDGTGRGASTRSTASAPRPAS